MAKQKQKILIVEDEKSLVRALELKLGHSGYSVMTAANGEEALEILKKKDFDLILMDLIMPQMNGFEFLKRLKKNENKSKKIVLSNLSQREDEIKAKELGANFFFVKANTPITDVVKHVKELLKS